jgi:RHS repeat-associated protein
VTENPGGTLSKSLYYSSAWQVLEEDWSGAVQVQYVWSPVYVDAMIERDRGSERFYVQQDANWNVTAIVNATTGVVQERYVYDPYGQPTILDPTTPSWNTRSASSFAWVYLHQGGRYDTGTGLYTFRNRDYSPTLGRWVQNDPLALAGGDTNLYRYAGDQPLGALDPSGLQPLFPPGNPAASVEWIWKKIRTWFRPGPSGTPAQLAPISRVGEISTDSTGKPLGSFTTHPEVTTAPGKPTCILSVVFHRGYFLMDRNSNPIQSSGIKIYERVFVHANTANFPVTANSVPTTNGQFMDSPGVGEGSNKPLPDSFDLFVTRIFYLKTGQANSPVIILGANDYRITRDAGDDATAVKNKSYMNAMYYPSGFSPAPGVPKGAQPDSGF